MKAQSVKSARILRGSDGPPFRYPKDPERDRTLTESFHRMLDALPMPMSPQYRMVCYGYVQVDVKFLKGVRR